MGIAAFNDCSSSNMEGLLFLSNAEDVAVKYFHVRLIVSMAFAFIDLKYHSSLITPGGPTPSMNQ